jgi:alpha-beta hydrolase superfamily lysophospholipase
MYIVSYDTALKDIDDAVINHKREDVPLFLMGHSMVKYVVEHFFK